MSPSTTAASISLVVPPVSKKRKAMSESVDVSKQKKRKHESTVNGFGDAYEIAPSSKKEKAKKVEKSKSEKGKEKTDVENNKPRSKDEKKERKEQKQKKKREKLQVKDDDQDEALLEEIESPAQVNDTTPFSIYDMDVDKALDADVADAELLPEQVVDIDASLMESQQPGPFYERRVSLQVPVSAISLKTATSSLLSQHLAPLLLTYFQPVDGIVLSFSDPILSASPKFGVNLPLKPPRSGDIPRDPPDETFARCADGFGVCWVWLTVTMVLFRPEKNDELKGWTNVTSEGFVGIVSYNYFQTAIGKARIPKSWAWDGPTREDRKGKKSSRKGKLKDDGAGSANLGDVVDSQESIVLDQAVDGGSGTFLDSDGNKVPANQIFKVVDVEMVPGAEKNSWTLQIEGSLLSLEEEETRLLEEKERFEAAQVRYRSKSQTPGLESDDMVLTGDSTTFTRIESPE